MTLPCPDYIRIAVALGHACGSPWAACTPPCIHPRGHSDKCENEQGAEFHGGRLLPLTLEEIAHEGDDGLDSWRIGEGPSLEWTSGDCTVSWRVAVLPQLVVVQLRVGSLFASSVLTCDDDGFSWTIGGRGFSGDTSELARLQQAADKAGS